MRACYPDREGYVESHGVPIFYEEYGEGPRAVLFIPPWQILHSRTYKAQILYFSRHFRVITYDPPGNGRSGRPLSGFDHNRAAADVLAVLDVTGTAQASIVCSSRSAWQGVILAAEHPERVERLVLTGCALDEGPRAPAFHEMRDRYEGWEKFNAPYWQENFRARLGFRPDQKVVLAAVGGTGVGHHLLRKVAASFPVARTLMPELRMIVVTGPRSIRDRSPKFQALNIGGSSPTSTPTSRDAIWRSSRGGSVRAWSSRPPSGPSSISRSRITSSKTSMSRTGWPGTGRGHGWSTTGQIPKRWPTPSPTGSSGQ